MKYKIVKLNILLAAWVLMLAPSCSQEELPSLQGGGGVSSEGAITFRFQGKKQIKSYSTPIASENENAIDSLEIYMFNDRSAIGESNILQKVFRVGSTDLSQQDTDLTATIDVTGRTGKHIFYFVANGKGNASSLESADAGSTTEADFLERLSDVQSGLLETPLLMTACHKIENVETPKEEDKKVTLLRRVARFDIVNDATHTNFTIDRIFIRKANLQGYIFGDATGIPVQKLLTDNLPEIEYGKMEDANTAVSFESLFYLYPTEMAEGKSMISFEGTFMGERRIYNLKNDQQIEANKRYVLKVKKVDENKIDLEISVDDWTDGSSTSPAEPETDDMAIGTISLTGGAGIQVTDKSYDVTNATTAGTIRIPVTTFNKVGTRIDVTYLHGTGQGSSKLTVTSPKPKLTYSASYVQEHRISIPVLKAPLHARVELVNNSKPEERDTLYINGIPNYDTTNEKPVLFGDIYWAPVNVGATEIGTTMDVIHHGLFFQWGRNVGFVYGGENANPSDIYPTPGPLDWETATTGDAKDKYIKGVSEVKYNWLSPAKEDLWLGVNKQGPCPEGWRVPTRTELRLIATANGSGYGSEDSKVMWNAVDKRLEIQGDNPSETLYIPAAGDRNHGSGSSKLQGSIGRCWGADPGDKYAVRLAFDTSSLKVDNVGRSFGYPVRCVQD
ncbi:uncharacterized protein (TIGR02145 family) [Parabacteroides sp. PF5-5]|uniref:hypothetical protein n=1 Tax=unclassified Parabacteroides TaxID=2649774 RepID=UPI00247683FE|nr:MULTISPECIES: hypothetical protein [unclassified Parabacteroides]MDH6303920.1 uncharacterized protein (TIGR02145 family) [Parabacteroides sp. PH5-39]MDH6314537.1 uncharacterized protein (TIGR02145 family) [Parabacteroides sp. PF5-13]MDH6318398.1 uncharacterized protein (TIGR02145 family) [Parabacteroides sp. PH5-13]MDH6322309.1 uncharacterized protein (TIGR02145 family) [Parabacteroides sp. PH5-8]MDH6325611.1 uncharacterized protein (TIGR02145 family) [Parabacteroides sp. PH5-41]